MPCPICTGALLSSVAQGAAIIGVVKHVKNRKIKSKPKPKTKISNK